MTSCGQTITQPAQPVHSPLSMTSSNSSFHCAVQRSRVGAGASSTTVIPPKASESAGRTPHVLRQVAVQVGVDDPLCEPPFAVDLLEPIVVAPGDDRLHRTVLLLQHGEVGAGFGLRGSVLVFDHEVRYHVLRPRCPVFVQYHTVVHTANLLRAVHVFGSSA